MIWSGGAFVAEYGLPRAGGSRACPEAAAGPPSEAGRQGTRYRQKVSVIAAVCVPPTRDGVRLYFRLHPDANIDADAVVAFLRVLSEQLSGPVVLVWDRLQAPVGLRPP